MVESGQCIVHGWDLFALLKLANMGWQVKKLEMQAN